MTTPNLPTQWFFTDTIRVPDPIAAIENLDPAIGIIFRHYDHPDRKGLAQQIMSIARDKGHILLVAGDAELAKEIKADGLHLREADLMNHKKDNAFQIITAACHSIENLKAAEELELNGVFISPVFTTKSHPEKPGLGEEGLRSFINHKSNPSSCPTLFALGGMTEEKFQKLKNNPDFSTLKGYGAIEFFMN